MASTPVRNRKPTKRALESDSPIIAKQHKKSRPPVQPAANTTTPPRSVLSTPPRKTPLTPPRSVQLTPPHASTLTPPHSTPLTPPTNVHTSPAGALPNFSTHPALTSALGSVLASIGKKAKQSPPEVAVELAKQAGLSDISVLPSFLSAPQHPTIAALTDTDLTPSASATPSPVPSETEQSNQVQTKQVIFKDPTFSHSSTGMGTGSRRHGKNLKQILASDRSFPAEAATYSSIDAPPSFRPAKKYSDITGLPAKYTDPQTKVRYATTEEFARIRVLPSDIVAGYLTLRKAISIVP